MMATQDNNPEYNKCAVGLLSDKNLNYVLYKRVPSIHIFCILASGTVYAEIGILSLWLNFSQDALLGASRSTLCSTESTCKK